MPAKTNAPGNYINETMQLVIDRIDQLQNEIDEHNKTFYAAKESGDKKTQYKESAKIKKLNEDKNMLLKTYRGMPKPAMSLSSAVVAMINYIEMESSFSASVKNKIIEKLKTKSAIITMSYDFYSLIEAEKRMKLYKPFLECLIRMIDTNTLSIENLHNEFGYNIASIEKELWDNTRNIAVRGGSSSLAAIYDAEIQAISRFLEIDLEISIPQFHHFEVARAQNNVVDDLKKFPVTYTEKTDETNPN